MIGVMFAVHFGEDCLCLHYMGVTQLLRVKYAVVLEDMDYIASYIPICRK